MKNTAFIGSGHIAGILTDNLLRRYGMKPEQVGLSDPDRARAEQLSSRFGTRRFDDNASAVSWADYIFICVHPVAVQAVIESIKTCDMKGKTIISVTAGTPVRRYRDAIPDAMVVRILPNPPSRLGEGAVPIVLDERMTDEEREGILSMISSLGPCFPVSEEKIDIFTSVTSPAPVFAFFEAMIDAALYCGLDHETSSRMVRQTIKGCLAMWEKGDERISSHLVEACTPGGTSVESLRVMDRGAFKSVVKEAYIAAFEKSRALGKN